MATSRLKRCVSLSAFVLDSGQIYDTNRNILLITGNRTQRLDGNLLVVQIDAFPDVHEVRSVNRMLLMSAPYPMSL
jgi:hypothetical protein